MTLWGLRRRGLCSRGALWFQSVTAVILLLLLTANEARATITVGAIEFESMPAIFGMTWVSNVEYRAHLQMLPSHPFLCDNDEGILHRKLKKVANLVSLRTLSAKQNERLKITDDEPIAVLTSRGGCSFEEKARQAMTMDNVAFVIVYDDRERSALVPMSASDPAGIGVGMLFVSQSTGSRKFQLRCEPRNVSRPCPF